MSAIIVENLGKRYEIGHQVHHDTLRDALMHGMRRLLPGARSRPRADREEFWALKDVSFKIEPGEVVGVIGRNGAGKSTLLKVLSRITEPTQGRVTINGRVASLLEVGTGFHPELSGRENIFLNGAILGMSRAEIRRKFDEIVAFAEVERFLDTPVKRYSSGMYVRLAFAVAAHLEPEILIVDEVLAVGDIAFQKRCLGKMQDVARDEGRTVLFVSHNLAAIRQLCNRTILLRQGVIHADGATAPLINQYLSDGEPPGKTSVPAPDPDQLHRAYVTDVAIETLEGKPLAAIPVGAAWQVRLRVRAVTRQRDFVAAVGYTESDGTPVQTSWHPPLELMPGDHEYVFRQDKVVLSVNTYLMVIGLTSAERDVQQFRFGRIEIMPAETQEYFQTTSGVGHVLNSMTSQYRAF